MLFVAEHWEGLRDGSITQAFRAWKRPTVRAGGTLQSPGGLLAIDAVDVIDPSDVTAADAHAAGARTVDEVLAEVLGPLRDDDSRRLYRIRFHRLGDDPRLALREDDDLTDDDRSAIDERLARWDRASPTGPWTAAVLAAIADHPGEVSTVLASELGVERMKLKGRIRQLKGLGLTISLGVGYRLSPRGEAYVGRRNR
jgi:hypothetical protein